MTSRRVAGLQATHRQDDFKVAIIDIKSSKPNYELLGLTVLNELTQHE